jgi:FkbM family methyltransferase
MLAVHGFQARRSLAAKVATGAGSWAGTPLSRCLPAALKELFWSYVSSAGAYTVHGSTMVLSAKDILNGSGKAMICGTYEIGTTRLLMRELQPGMVFLDVGAHVGYYTCLAARLVGPEGRVIALEPHPGNALALKQNVAINNYRHVTVIEKAASDRTRRERLFVNQNSGHHSFYPFEPGRENDFVEVEASRLDDVLAALGVGRVHMMKVDVEGAEGRVLSGMTKTLTPRNPPKIIMEYNPERERVAGYSASQFLKLLMSYGLSRISVIDDELTLRSLKENGNWHAQGMNLCCTAENEDKICAAG